MKMTLSTDFVDKSSGVSCPYSNSSGIELIYCPEKCCGTPVGDREEACCTNTTNSGVYIGASLGTAILIAVIILSHLYCRKRKLQSAPEHARVSYTVRTRPHPGSLCHEPSIPSISINIEPIQPQANMRPLQPPPYESLEITSPYFPSQGPTQDIQDDQLHTSMDQPTPAHTQNVKDDE